MYLLFPGRHHLLTRFQGEYLTRHAEGRTIVFAVTSADHGNTRRNPAWSLTANTRAALMRAHLLGPQDPDVRMLVAADLLDQGKTADARKMLGPIAYAPHRDDNATLAATMMATIDKDVGPAALAKWREATKGAKKDAKGANAA